AEYNYTPEELLDYERYAMKQDEIATSISDAKKEGEERGKAEGKLEKAREIAVNLLRNNVDVNIIAASSGLSVEEIESLKN
ncbi:MAG: hypothetical protein LBC04_03185, partial [Holosporaceae bacterium]|nr:hypothetical protein [Holosporaceae bacterium]